MKIDLDKINTEEFRILSKDTEFGKLFLINPMDIAVKWNQENKVFRSSIWDQDGNPVSLSFPKFMNFGEKPHEFPPPNSLDGCEILEKLDGSALIVSLWKGKFIARTRGTFCADQFESWDEVQKLIKEENIESFFREKSQNDSCDFSLIFEYVSPNCRIVIDYDKPSLYLIGGINHLCYSLVGQDYLDEIARQYKWKRPKRFKFDSLQNLMETVAEFKGVEGVCLYSDKGQVIHKIKGSEYLELHRVKSYVSSFSKVLDVFVSLKYPPFEEFYKYIEQNLSYEIAEIAKPHMLTICDRYLSFIGKLERIKQEINVFKSQNLSKKEFASVVIESYQNPRDRAICFSLFDRGTIDDKLIKKELDERA